MAGRQRGQAFPIRGQERAGADKQRAGPALDKGCKGGLDFAVAADIKNDELLPDRLRRGLHVFSLRLGRRVPGLTSMPIVVALGTSWRSSSSRFAPNTAAKKLTPVTLPPGRFMLATRPSLTGSPPLTNTIGIVEVAALAASAALDCLRQSRPLAVATIQRPEPEPVGLTVRDSDIRSRRSGPRRSLLPSGPGGTQPRGESSVGERRAAEKSDHRHAGLLRARGEWQYRAAPPTSEMNSRRLMQLPPRLMQAHHSTAGEGWVATAPSSNSAPRSSPRRRPRRGCRPP